MIRPFSIAALTALASFLTAYAQVGPTVSAPPECDGPDAPIKVSVDSVHDAVVVTLGPCHIPPSMHEHDLSMAMMNHAGGEDVRVHFRWPTNTWVRSFDLQVFDKDAQPLRHSAAIHHLEIFNFDRRQVAYPMIERLLGFGEETDAIKLPRSVGIPLEAGMDLGLSIRWNNQTGADMHGVTLRLTLGYSPRNLAPRPTAVLPFKVDVNSRPGAGDAFDLPPGGGSRSAVFTVGVSGRLVAVGGHLHDFGKEIRLEDAQTGKVIARVMAHRTPDGEVSRVSRSLFGIVGRGPHLTAGRPYRLVAVYEGSPTDTIRGAMGLLAGIFTPDHYDRWPKLDRTNPDYLADLKPSERTTPGTPARLADGPSNDGHSQHHHSP